MSALLKPNVQIVIWGVTSNSAEKKKQSDSLLMKGRNGLASKKPERARGPNPNYFLSLLARQGILGRPDTFFVRLVLYEYGTTHIKGQLLYFYPASPTLSVTTSLNWLQSLSSWEMPFLSFPGSMAEHPNAQPVFLTG